MPRTLSDLCRSLSLLRWSISGVATADRVIRQVSAETLESRVLFALAAASGGSGLSADLSSNAAIRRQQLICDPSAAPVAGSLSVSYDPTDVTLVDVESAPGYMIDYNKSRIEVTSDGCTFAEPLSNFLCSVGKGTPTEDGDVDIYFTECDDGTPGLMPLSPGYTQVQESGPIGYDSCVATFQVLSSVPLPVPKYTVFADPNAIGGQPDFLETSSGQTITPASITPATVGGPSQGVSVDTADNALIISDSAPTANDTVLVKPAGRSCTGTTGITVQTTLNGVRSSQTYTQAFSAVYVFLQDGKDNVVVDPFLLFSAFVSAGKGNDNVQLGSGTNIVTLGNGNDNVLAIGSSNTVTAGNGNDNIVVGNILLSNGTNRVALGNGNDNVLAVGRANASNSVSAGDGKDNVVLGAGNNQSVTLGNGNDNVYLGQGNDDIVSVGTGIDDIQIGNGNDNTVYYAGSRAPKVKFGKGSGNTVKT